MLKMYVNFRAERRELYSRMSVSERHAVCLGRSSGRVRAKARYTHAQ